MRPYRTKCLRGPGGGGVGARPPQSILSTISSVFGQGISSLTYMFKKIRTGGFF